MSSEKSIETAFVKIAKAAGCLALKLVLLNRVGFPDRTVLAPGGRVLFLEFKKPGGRVSPQQSRWLKILRGLGFRAEVVDNVVDAERHLTELIR